MNQFESMRIFSKVAQCLNFSDAARQLGISNSAVTRGLTNLERHLNLRLINRTTRHVSLTPAGQTYLEGCSDLLLQLEQMEDRVRAESRSAAGRLKLAVPAFFASTGLPSLIAEFRLSNPLVGFDMTVYETASQIVPEDFEVCIMIERKLRDSSLICRAIGRTTDVIVASPSYLARRGVPESPRQLSDHDILLDGESLMRYWTFTDSSGDTRVTLAPFLAAQNASAILRASLDGLGIARLPFMFVQDHLRTGKLTTVLNGFDLEGSERTVWMLYAGQRYATHMVRTFIDFAVRKEFGDAPSQRQGSLSTQTLCP
ncbi:LysR family transcriptional regulator [Paraburkholderia sp. SIMBA_053]|uniref:LysR family transcriptional regulator n=1 Tax=Paraburkholderia sp. SIMBA_053 TaxID=3085794 RepID=UPI00397AAFAE